MNRIRAAVSSLRGAREDRAPLTAAAAPHFGLLKILFLEHRPKTRQQAMMEKGIITFKHNFSLTFSRSLRNCWQPTAVHISDAIFRLINAPLRMCRGREMSCRIVIGTSYVIMS